MIKEYTAHDLKCDLAADVIRRFGTLRLRVTGFSMLSALWPGDVLSISRVDWDAYRPGDILLFTRNRRLFVHRLVEVKGETAVTRGDASMDPDPPIHASAVLGRVSAVERRGVPIAVPDQVSWCGRLGGLLLGQSGRLVRLTGSMRADWLKSLLPADERG